MAENCGSKFRRLSVAAILSVMIVGCETTVRLGPDAPRLELAVPKSLQGVDPMIVTHRSFGPYRTRRIRGEYERWTLPMGDLAFSETSFRRRFLFSQGDGEEREVRCLGNDRQTRLGGAIVRQRKKSDPPELACTKADPSDEPRWVVVLWSTRQREAGYVEFGSQSQRWQVVRGEAATPWPDDDRVGYLLRDGDQVVAAIELAGRGRVWIPPGLSAAARHSAAVTAAVLLVYDSDRLRPKP